MANPFEGAADPPNPFAAEDEEAAENPFSAEVQAGNPFGEEATREVSEAMTAVTEDGIAKTVSAHSLDSQGVKFQNAETCALCSLALGKRYMRPRHHCRLCHLSVCAACSPSTIQMKGDSSLQRACNSCMQQMLEMNELQDRMLQVAGDLGSLARTSSSPAASVAEAVAACEAAAAGLQDLRASHDAATTQVSVLKQQQQETEAAQLKAAQAALKAQAELRDCEAQRVEATARLQQEQLQRSRAEAKAQSFAADAAKARDLEERVAQLQHALESRKSSLEAGKWERWPKAHIPFSLVSQLNMVSNPRLKSASRLTDAGCSAPAPGRGVDAIFALGCGQLCPKTTGRAKLLRELQEPLCHCLSSAFSRA
ncbi:unnamed protein product [Effrenium voratum]|nr:unnamed protein product [Effrenium voratum]